MSAASELRAAADLLDRDGWCQNTARDATGRRCAVSALADRGFVALQPVVGGCVSDWNDASGQTAENVKATMRRLADELDAQ